MFVTKAIILFYVSSVLPAQQQRNLNLQSSNPDKMLVRAVNVLHVCEYCLCCTGLVVVALLLHYCTVLGPLIT